MTSRVTYTCQSKRVQVRRIAVDIFDFRVPAHSTVPVHGPRKQS